jgi:tRNA U34 5-methylaminomethyl-2-thiouridine-forming methyltransferase MnmC
MLYERCADKKPIMRFDVQEQRIYWPRELIGQLALVLVQGRKVVVFQPVRRMLRLVHWATRDQLALFGPVFEPLRDPALFSQVQIDPEFHTLTWPNGADFAAEFLHRSVGVTA